jgi:hypothetical protein
MYQEEGLGLDKTTNATSPSRSRNTLPLLALEK